MWFNLILLNQILMLDHSISEPKILKLLPWKISEASTQQSIGYLGQMNVSYFAPKRIEFHVNPIAVTYQITWSSFLVYSFLVTNVKQCSSLKSNVRQLYLIELFEVPFQTLALMYCSAVPAACICTVCILSDIWIVLKSTSSDKVVDILFR